MLNLMNCSQRSPAVSMAVFPALARCICILTSSAGLFAPRHSDPYLYDGNQVIDTGSVWNIFGKAVSGPLTGRTLASVDNGIHFAFAWLAFYPQADIYLASKKRVTQD